MLSVVIPIYNEEKNIELLHSKIVASLDKLGGKYEIIYVDDGSKDSSFGMLSKIVMDNNNVKVIQFKRNFGQTAALSAGINYSNGEILVLMDGDLQNDPKDIPKLLKKIEEGYDVVSGWRRKRKDSLFSRRIPSFIANKLISYITGVKLHDYGCTLKAYRRETIKNINLYGEMHRFIPVYAAWMGSSIAEVEVSHYARTYGKSKYGLFRIFKVVIDLITLKFIMSYSTRPNYIFGGLGIILFFIGVLVVAWTIIFKIQRGILLAVLFFIMGIQFVLMGLLVEIVIRIHGQPLVKPDHMIKNILINKK